MRISSFLPAATGLATLVSARAISPRGTVLWDGRFNDMTSSSDLDKWSFSNPVGSYQYYIHGPGETTDYVNLSPDFKNPADTVSEQGVKITLDDTAFWNGQNMRRTELIPQTSAAINKGKVYYHFSIKRSDVNPPMQTREHQIAFFESHFTELKAGWLSGAEGTSDSLLRWMVDGKTQWSVEWDADVWHNVAYEIDFDAGTVGLWHSTGGSALTQAVAPMTASTSSNGADFHVGVLELPRDGYADDVEDLYFSGIYIESGSLTTAIGSGASSGDDETSPAPSSSSAPAPAPSSTDVPVESTAPSATAPASSTEPTAEAPAETTVDAPAEPTAVETSVPVAEPTATSPAGGSPTTAPSSPVATATPSPSSTAPATPAPTKPSCKRRKNRKRRAARH